MDAKKILKQVISEFKVENYHAIHELEKVDVDSLSRMDFRDIAHSDGRTVYDSYEWIDYLVNTGVNNIITSKLYRAYDIVSNKYTDTGDKCSGRTKLAIKKAEAEDDFDGYNEHTWGSTTSIPLKLATPGSAGHDISSPIDVTIEPGASCEINTGVIFNIEPGYHVQIHSRSGLGFRHRVTAFLGIIDSDYHDSVIVMLKNDGDKKYEVKAGERIAQAVLVKHEHFVNAEVINPKAESHIGFGGSGTH